MLLIILISVLIGFSLVITLLVLFLWRRLAQQSQSDAYLSKDLDILQQQGQSLLKEVRDYQQSQLKQTHQYQLDNVKLMQESLQHVQQQLLALLSERITAQNEQIGQLHQIVDRRLQQISGQVEERLQQGFEKTTAVFSDVIKRLALIDEAQKKITDLSQSVVSLQEVLSDKRSRGAFGEVQLEALVRNLIPETHFAFQHELGNGKRCDCILFLPAPTGNIVVDAKFPLESYQKMLAPETSELERREAERQFKIDIKKHIKDIAEKYIVVNETAEGAMMFVPAEAVFAEIHGHYPDLVAEAQRMRVWITSPTTLMAVLTTARAVLKDAATRQQVHIIQEHLQGLAKDFKRFQDRMDNLGRHIAQAHKDVEEVQTSANKITSRFQKIDKVEIDLLKEG
ncbi:MAG: RmuC family protein [Gammaproteobacteria bacterium]|jgi:DNA recombination protein RmuC|nr:RmuC family protein [Gammaproteobacteria bacterium]